MKIFIITLSSNENRQNFMEIQFYNKPLDVEFITGIDGRKLDTNIKNSLYDEKKALRIEKNLTPGEIGCSLSHKLAYE
jgi:GR25 family glycosyltransferase involved in LPS biosynthesis